MGLTLQKIDLAQDSNSGPDFQRPQVRILREVNFSQCLFLAAVVLTAVAVLVTLKLDSTLNVEILFFILQFFDAKH